MEYPRGIAARHPVLNIFVAWCANSCRYLAHTLRDFWCMTCALYCSFSPTLTRTFRPCSGSTDVTSVRSAAAGHRVEYRVVRLLLCLCRTICCCFLESVVDPPRRVNRIVAGVIAVAKSDSQRSHQHTRTGHPLTKHGSGPDVNVITRKADHLQKRPTYYGPLSRSRAARFPFVQSGGCTLGTIYSPTMGRRLFFARVENTRTVGLLVS